MNKKYLRYCTISVIHEAKEEQTNSEIHLNCLYKQCFADYLISTNSNN